MLENYPEILTLEDVCKIMRISKPTASSLIRSHLTAEGERVKVEIGGAAVIARYYEIAPGIVSRINATAGADGIWNRIYSEVILPCVEMIRTQRYEQAFDTYQQAVLGLEKQFA